MKSKICRYNKAFYRSNDIEIAIRNYKRIARIVLREEEKYYICYFSDCVVNIERVIHEFNNYLIELMNSHEELSNK